MFRELGVDGVVYEAFEPGVGVFATQLDALARGLHGEPVRHEPTPLELRCRASAVAPPIRQRVLEYLTFPEAGDAAWLEAHLPGQGELAALLRDYLERPQWELWRKVARLALAHRGEWDWSYLLYRLATYLPDAERPPTCDPLAQRLFATPKPWDFLREHPGCDLAALFARMEAGALDLRG